MALGLGGRANVVRSEWNGGTAGVLARRTSEVSRADGSSSRRGLRHCRPSKGRDHQPNSHSPRGTPIAADIASEVLQVRANAHSRWRSVTRPAEIALVVRWRLSDVAGRLDAVTARGRPTQAGEGGRVLLWRRPKLCISNCATELVAAWCSPLAAASQHEISHRLQRRRRKQAGPCDWPSFRSTHLTERPSPIAKRRKPTISQRQVGKRNRVAIGDVFAFIRAFTPL